MYINEVNIMLSEQERQYIKDFFEQNKEYIKTHSFFYSENIKEFGNLLENYINTNNLRSNNIMMLFLYEIKISELEYKITDNTIKTRVERKTFPKNRLNSTISRWYNESRITRYITAEDVARIDSRIKPLIEQNEKEREESWQYAKDIVVK